MPDSPTICLLTLGPPEVRVAGEHVELPPRLLALLVYLTVASPRGVIRRDSLLAAFWPNRTASRSRNALNQALHQLRSRIGEDAVESRGHEELVVTARLESDVGRFEDFLDGGQRASALELYSGPFLEGFHVRNAAGFERWLDGVRARLRRRAREAALTLAADAERQGRLNEAAAYLRRAVGIVPSDERVSRRLICLLLEDDDRSAAVREYRRLERHLKGDLGIRPSEETRELVQDATGLSAAPHGFSRSAPARRAAGRLSERAEDIARAGRAGNAAARELLEQALHLDPGSAGAHAAFARATAHWVQLFGGPWDALASARSAARRAVEIEPARPGTHFSLGLSLEASGRAGEAARTYRALLDQHPGDVPAAVHLGRSLTFQGDFVAALRWTEDVGRRTDPGPELLSHMGMLQHCLGHDGEGEDAFERALDRRPGFRWAQGSWIYFDLVKGRLDRARRRADRMVNREPDGFVGLFAAGDARLAAGDPAGALPYYLRCYRLEPESRHSGIQRATRTVLGFAYLQSGEPERGLELLTMAEQEDRRALRAGVSFGGVHYDLASIHAARDEEERAIAWLQRAYRAGWLQHDLLRCDPLFASLRGDDRIEELLQAMERTVREQREQLR